jgi:two-component system, NarL family, sensor histidine kinase DesK
MSALTSSHAGAAPWTARQARWLLVGLHVALLAVPVAFTITGFDGDPRNPAVVVPVALAIGALQLRHSFAAARDVRPRGWPWTLLALVVLVYLPTAWFTWDWAAAQYFVLASALLLLRGRLAAIVFAGPIVGSAAAGVREGLVGHASAAQTALLVPYWIVGLVGGGMALYASARLVWVATELHATRIELAELAVGRERLRVSRDLHDLLGQSLSAISLKGELAGRLLDRDPSAARTEIDGLTQVARDALRGMRAVTHRQHAVSLRAEIDAAAALLQAAGIEAGIDLDAGALPRPVEEVLGWAVREGVTNVLRHSEARACQITAVRWHGRVRLELVNDGARAAAPAGSDSRRGDARGSGLVGLAERARALAGAVSHQRTGDGRFRLLVEVPVEVPQLPEPEGVA